MYTYDDDYDNHYGDDDANDDDDDDNDDDDYDDDNDDDDDNNNHDDDDDVCTLKYEIICFLVNKHHNISYSHIIISYESLHIVIHSFIHSYSHSLSIYCPGVSLLLAAKVEYRHHLIGGYQIVQCKHLAHL